MIKDTKEPSGETTVMKEDVQSVNNENLVQEDSADRKSPFWKSVMIGGIPGVVLGAVGSAAVTDIYAASHIAEAPESQSDSDNSEIPTTGSSDAVTPEIDAVADIAHNVSDSMSFGEAFSTARAEVGSGGVFVWHGNYYSTYTAEEWDVMDANDRHNYAESVNAAFGQSSPNREHDTTQDLESAQESSDSNEPEIRVLTVSAIDNNDGTETYVGSALVNGHYSEFQDLDGDGLVDQLLVDVNDNGIVDDNEVLPTQGSGLTVGDLLLAAENQPMPENIIYAETPDYTNDADVSSLV